MTYRVAYYTLAILKDGRIGNIQQGADCFYTNEKIENLPYMLNSHLAKGEQKGVITSISDIEGYCLNKTYINKPKEDA